MNAYRLPARAFHPVSAGAPARPWRVLLALALLLAAALLAACKSEHVAAQASAPPPPLEISADARGHYCGMYLSEHAGPKGQVRVRDLATPLWFTSIREVFSFLAAPDEPKAVTAVYVQDMARRQADGSFPPDAWIDARTAWYVIGSGVPDFPAADDAMPFAREADAQAFRSRHGGQVVTFAAMPEDFVRTGADAPQAEGGTPTQGASS